jgi:enamine deaminase RidA (YjgF/YER057c/UK114 family)
MSLVEARLSQLGLSLPTPPAPAANYTPWVITGDLVFLSGQTAKQGNEVLFKGKVGQALSIEQGYCAAQLCTLRLLSALKDSIGDLDKVEKIVKLSVFVNAADDFIAHPKVADGASDLLEKLFTQSGPHARAAVGVSSLPNDSAVEIAMIAQVQR